MSRYGNIIKDKKGWIKVIEAFIAIALFTGMLFLLLQGDPLRQEKKDFIELKQREILSAIQINDTLRNDILNFSDFELDSNDTEFPESLRNFIDENMYSNIKCYLKICLIDSSCEIMSDASLEVYAKDILITSTLTTYTPRRLKMFCLR